MGHIQGVVSHH